MSVVSLRIGRVTVGAVAALFTLALASCGTEKVVVVTKPAPAETATTSVPTTTTPPPAPTRTVVKTVVKTVTSVGPSTAAPTPTVTDPWAVVAAYYGDVGSKDYSEAWALLGYGMTTHQTYQQFVDGYSCTGAETVAENSESGDEVNVTITAPDTCSGETQYYEETATVVDGRIVAASVHQIS